MDNSKDFEWLEDEKLMLEDELFETNAELDKLRAEMWTTKQNYQHLKNNIKDVRKAVKAEFIETNNQLGIQLAEMHTLVDEYDRIITQYIYHTGTKLTTNRLNELRERGGLPRYDN